MSVVLPISNRSRRNAAVDQVAVTSGSVKASRRARDLHEYVDRPFQGRSLSRIISWNPRSRACCYLKRVGAKHLPSALAVTASRSTGWKSERLQKNLRRLARNWWSRLPFTNRYYISSIIYFIDKDIIGWPIFKPDRSLKLRRIRSNREYLLAV